MEKFSEDAESCAGCLSGCITNFVLFMVALVVLFFCLAAFIGQF